MENQIDITNLQELKDKLEELSLNDIIIRNSLQYYKNGNIPYENALLTAIIYLSQQCKIYEKQLIDIQMRMPVLKPEASVIRWDAKA